MAITDAEHSTRFDAFRDSTVLGTGDQFLETTKRIAMRGEVHRAHVRATGTERGDQGNPVAEDAGTENLGQYVLEGSVAPVYDEKVDFLSCEVCQGVGHDAGVLGFDMKDIGMAAQEAKHTADLILALSRA
jgi:hypothetical protein